MTIYFFLCCWSLIRHGMHCVSPGHHLPTYLSQKGYRNSEVRFWHWFVILTTKLSSCVFVKLLPRYHSMGKIICVFIRAVQVHIGNGDGIHYLSPHPHTQRTMFLNYSYARCDTSNCASFWSLISSLCLL